MTLSGTEWFTLIGKILNSLSNDSFLWASIKWRLSSLIPSNFIWLIVYLVAYILILGINLIKSDTPP